MEWVQSISSAADWASQTLAAAEAYAEEQAAQAAQERAQAEAAAAAVPHDTVDPPPSAQQRALDVFYANDPNRPSNTLPGAGQAQSNQGGPSPVEPTPQEAADMQAAGLTVTPAGNGTYLINAPTENINIVEKPPVQPPPSMPIPPSHGGNTTTAPPSILQPRRRLAARGRSGAAAGEGQGRETRAQDQQRHGQGGRRHPEQESNAAETVGRCEGKGLGRWWRRNRLGQPKPCEEEAAHHLHRQV